MNYKMVGFVLGRIFLIEAVLMLFPWVCRPLWRVEYHPRVPVARADFAGTGLGDEPAHAQNTKIYARDGLAIVALVWVLMSVLARCPL